MNSHPNSITARADLVGRNGYAKHRRLPGQQKYKALCNFLSGLKGPVAVAFSGGMDSMLLLDAAAEAVSGEVYAFTLQSILNHPLDIAVVSNMSGTPGINFIPLDWEPLIYPEIVRNDSLRCYYCKFRMYSLILKECRKKNISCLMDGTQLDDLHKDRPGARAVSELGVLTPLADFLLDKQDIRHISLKKSIYTWKHSSRSCMATRVATGTPLKAENLKVIRDVEGIIADIDACDMHLTLYDREVRLVIESRLNISASIEKQLSEIKKIVDQYSGLSLKIQKKF